MGQTDGGDNRPPPLDVDLGLDGNGGSSAIAYGTLDYGNVIPGKIAQMGSNGKWVVIGNMPTAQSGPVTLSQDASGNWGWFEEMPDGSMQWRKQASVNEINQLGWYPDGKGGWTYSPGGLPKPEDPRPNATQQFPDGSIWALDPITKQPLFQIAAARPTGVGSGSSGGGGGGGGGGGYVSTRTGGFDNTNTNISEIGPVNERLQRDQMAQQYKMMLEQLGFSREQLAEQMRQFNANLAFNQAEAERQFGLAKSRLGMDATDAYVRALSSTNPLAAIGFRQAGGGNLWNAYKTGNTAITPEMLALAGDALARARQYNPGGVPAQPTGDPFAPGVTVPTPTDGTTPVAPPDIPPPMPATPPSGGYVGGGSQPSTPILNYGKDVVSNPVSPTDKVSVYLDSAFRAANGTYGYVNDSKAIVGDSPNPNPFVGKPNPELVVNPTRAPIAVVPLIDKSFGGTSMPGRPVTDDGMAGDQPKVPETPPPPGTITGSGNPYAPSGDVPYMPIYGWPDTEPSKPRAAPPPPGTITGSGNPYSPKTSWAPYMPLYGPDGGLLRPRPTSLRRTYGSALPLIDQAIGLRRFADGTSNDSMTSQVQVGTVIQRGDGYWEVGPDGKKHFKTAEAPFTVQAGQEIWTGSSSGWPTPAVPPPSRTPPAGSGRRQTYTPTQYGFANQLVPGTTVYQWDPINGGFTKPLAPGQVMTPGVQYEIEGTRQGEVVSLPPAYKTTGLPDPTALMKTQARGAPAGSVGGINYSTPAYGDDLPMKQYITSIDTGNSPFRYWNDPNQATIGKAYMGGVYNPLTGQVMDPETALAMAQRSQAGGAAAQAIAAGTTGALASNQYRGIRGLDPNLSGFNQALLDSVLQSTVTKGQQAIGTFNNPTLQSAAPPTGGASNPMGLDDYAWKEYQRMNASPTAQFWANQLAEEQAPRYADGTWFNDPVTVGTTAGSYAATPQNQTPSATNAIDEILRTRMNTPLPPGTNTQSLGLLRAPTFVRDVWAQGMAGRTGVPAAAFMEELARMRPRGYSRIGIGY